MTFSQIAEAQKLQKNGRRHILYSWSAVIYLHLFLLRFFNSNFITRNVFTV